jgi:hypothetical protein
MLTQYHAAILGFPRRNWRTGLWEADPAYFICSVHLLLERPRQ